MSYNAGMGTSDKPGAKPERDHQPELDLDAWLRGGGLVIAASERARRALTDRYHRARRAEGLSAWPAPAIQDWQNFLRNTWEGRAGSEADDRLVLDPAQEKSLWAEIAGAELRLATLLNGPRNRMAALAMRAHELICSYAPQYLRLAARSAWQLDAGVFSGWLTEFDQACNAGKLLSPARLPLELIAQLEREPSDGAASRPPILLAGFDRILPVQRRFLDAWGAWRLPAHGERAREVHFYRTADTQTELTACALWCRQKLAAYPNAKLLVVSQDIQRRRGEIERAFLPLAPDAGSSPIFEFSLGIPLSNVALARSAHFALRWLSNSLDESEVDWLFSCGFLAAESQESAALQNYMRALRRRGLERPQWTLAAFLNQQVKATLPLAWVNRILEAQRRLNEQARSRKSPMDWAEFVPNLLQMIGWPGARPLSSEEFQVLRRWELALKSCAALGFDGRLIPWPEFMIALADALDETLFAPESRDAPIQIAGPSESAGLDSDAIWFLGASEDAWPAAGTTHPLLPLDVQREAAMPHATAQLDWDLSDSIVERLLSSAPEVCFSFARHDDDAEARPSRMIVRIAGDAQALPVEFIAPKPSSPETIPFEDSSRIAFQGSKVQGGSSVLTHQSQCAFKAFAAARLAAQRWNPAEPCLTAAQRGQLLHAVLHSIWGGPKSRGIRTLTELRTIEDREAFIAVHARRAMQELNRSISERLPHRYLEMEERRLIALIGAWLDYELTRVGFTILQTENQSSVAINGLTLDLRLDRIDQLADGTLLVIDYKTGLVTTKAWELPRPDDVQLPLYASFAIKPDETLGGLAFARVRRGDDLGFAGHINNARANLIPSLRETSSLVKKGLDKQTLQDWKVYIASLARDFLSGCADVSPRDYPKTCERCGLQSLCRIQEHRVLIAQDDVVAGEEAGDE